MSNTMETNFKGLQNRIGDMEKRMDCLEEKINAAPLVPATTSSAESTDRESAPRRRKTPPELQVT